MSCSHLIKREFADRCSGGMREQGKSTEEGGIGKRDERANESQVSWNEFITLHVLFGGQVLFISFS